MKRLGLLLVCALLVACGTGGTATAQASSALDTLLGSARPSENETAERVASGVVGGPALDRRQVGDTVELQKGRRTLRQVEAPRVRELYRGGLYHQCEGALFLLAGTGDDTRLAVMDVASGESFGEIEGPRDVKCAGRYAFVTTEAMPWVVDLHRREARELRYSLPNGQPIADSFVFPLMGGEGALREAMIYTRDGENVKFLGRWRPGDGTAIEVRPSPLGHIFRARYVGEILEVQSTTPAPIGGGDGLFYVDDQGGQRFEEDLSNAHFMQGGYTVYESTGNGAGIISPSTEVIDVALASCRFRPDVIAVADVAMVAICQDRDEAFENYFYFHVDGQVETFRRRRGFERGSTMQVGRMRPGFTTVYEYHSPAGQPVGEWFDLRRGLFFQGSPLWGIPVVGTSGMPAQFLATSAGEVEGRRGAPIELYAVDLDEATEEYLHTYEDCPGFLQYVDSEPGRYLVQCLVQPEPGTFRFRYQWSELIDLTTNTRWRETERRFEAFTPAGVVLSDVSVGQDAMYSWQRQVWVY